MQDLGIWASMCENSVGSEAPPPPFQAKDTCGETSTCGLAPGFQLEGASFPGGRSLTGARRPGGVLKRVSFVSVLPPQLSYVMSGYRCFVCPVEYNNDTNSFTVDCEPSDLFRLHEYSIPEVIQSATGWVCAAPVGRSHLRGIVTTK